MCSHNFVFRFSAKAEIILVVYAFSQGAFSKQCFASSGWIVVERSECWLWQGHPWITSMANCCSFNNSSILCRAACLHTPAIKVQGVTTYLDLLGSSFKVQEISKGHIWATSMVKCSFNISGYLHLPGLFVQGSSHCIIDSTTHIYK